MCVSYLMDGAESSSESDMEADEQSEEEPGTKVPFISGHPLTADPNRANYGGLALGGLPIFIRTLPPL